MHRTRAIMVALGVICAAGCVSDSQDPGKPDNKSPSTDVVNRTLEYWNNGTWAPGVASPGADECGFTGPGYRDRVQWTWDIQRPSNASDNMSVHRVGALYEFPSAGPGPGDPQAALFVWDPSGEEVLRMAGGGGPPGRFGSGQEVDFAMPWGTYTAEARLCLESGYHAYQVRFTVHYTDPGA